jgi:hypothetical protein
MPLDYKHFKNINLKKNVLIKIFRKSKKNNLQFN